MSYKILTSIVLLACASESSSSSALYPLSKPHRIVNGDLVHIEEHPYMVSLQYSRFRLPHYCGGSLISPTCVLSAAHCFNLRKPGDVKARHITAHAGKTRTSEASQSRSVVRIFSHPEYDINNLNLDVAILKLNASLSGKYIETIPLDLTCDVEEGDDIIVAGWGETEAYKPSRSLSRAPLRDITKMVHDQKSCEMLMHLLGHPFVTDNMFCAAGNDYEDACQGDSGGPAIRDGEQVGIVSWGVGCGHYGGVYTRLHAAPVASFVKRIMAEHC